MCNPGTQRHTRAARHHYNHHTQQLQRHCLEGQRQTAEKPQLPSIIYIVVNMPTHALFPEINKAILWLTPSLLNIQNVFQKVKVFSRWFLTPGIWLGIIRERDKWLPRIKQAVSLYKEYSFVTGTTVCKHGTTTNIKLLFWIWKIRVIILCYDCKKLLATPRYFNPISQCPNFHSSQTDLSKMYITGKCNILLAMWYRRFYTRKIHLLFGRYAFSVLSLFGNRVLYYLCLCYLFLIVT